jgi:hypothetical protein
MLKYQLKVNESFKESLRKKLKTTALDSEIQDCMTSYLYDNAQIMERLIEGLEMWTIETKTENSDPLVFFLGILKLMDLFKKNMEKWTGITEEYLSMLSNKDTYNITETQPWQFEGHEDAFSGLRGVHESLQKNGINQELIDRYYIDGNLLEIYDNCISTISSLSALIETKKPSINDLRDGILIVENNFRKLYYRLFIEEFDGAIGFFACLYEVIKKLDKGIHSEKGDKQ